MFLASQKPQDQRGVLSPEDIEAVSVCAYDDTSSDREYVLHRIIAIFIGLNLTGPVWAQLPELPQPNGEPQTMKAYITGYSYWDNTPPGSVDISHPMRHRIAGGMGTYSNPITLAVGHQIIEGEDILDIAAGTLFYLPRLRKYAVVEDTCGDGPTPQDGACHIGYEGLVWLDIYVSGDTSEQAVSDRCMQAITGIQPIVMDPGPNMSVVVGPITESGCYYFPDP